jgi:hypothetical protein
MESVHTEELRGYTINILPDTDPQNPRKEYDHVFTMVCSHRDYNLGDVQTSDPEAAIRDVYHDHGVAIRSKVGEPETWTIDHLDECRIIWLPLYLYDHSGITMNTTGFNCMWDSSIIGFIYISLDKAHEEWKVAAERMTEEEFSHMIKIYMKGEVDEYDNYLTSEVYGYVITKTDTEAEILSCWGFYGDYEEECLKDARVNVPDEPAKPDNTIIMVFHNDGTVEFTRNPKLYPFFDGRGDMQRISEIRKEEYGPKYYIEWLRGKWAGAKHTRTIARNYFTPDTILNSHAEKFSPEHMLPGNPMLFDTYEDAVLHEVAMLNAMRLAGDTFVENPLKTLANID